MEKKYALFVLPILLAVMFLSFTSAALTVTGAPGTISGQSGTFTLNISSTSNESVSLSLPQITQSTAKVTFSLSSNNFLLNGSANKTDSRSVVVTYNVSDPDSYFTFLDSSSYHTTLTVTGNVSGSQTKTIYYENTNFCSGIPTISAANLYVDTPSFSVKSGYGDSSTWYLLDNISATMDVQNNGNYDMRNVKLQWALYTRDGNRIESGNTNSFSLNSGDDKQVTINFQLDRSMNRIDQAGGDVVLYVKATGTIRDPAQNSVIDGNQTCYSSSESSYVETGDSFVVPSDLTFNGNLIPTSRPFNGSVSCGSIVTIAGSAYNIGSNDESTPYVRIYNQELGINRLVNLPDINAFTSQDFSTTFSIPKNASQKLYQLQVMVYNDNNNIYENGQNDQAVKIIPFNVAGNCQIVPPTVTAAISSGTPQAGKQVTVHVYLRNDDSHTATFFLSAEGYNSWANLVNMTPQTFSLPSGTSQDVYMTLDLKPTSEGTRQFSLVATANGQIVVNKPVVLTIEAGSFWNTLASWNVNWGLIGIIALNLILVIIIIIVAIKVLRRK